MPALPNVNKVLRAVINWQVDGDTMGATVHHWRYTGSQPSASDDVAIAAEIVAEGDSAFGGLCNAHVGMNTCTVTDLTSDTAPEGTGGTPWLGTRTGGQLSPGTAVVVRHAIGRRYRGGHPRSYLPLGTSTDLQTSGLWTTAFQSAVDSAWGTFNSVVVGAINSITAGAELVNVSYYKGFTVVTSPTTGRARNVPTVRATPVVDTVTGHTVALNIGSQRRRNRDA